ncbi:hypothetical protein NC652_011117 [Populus alba x Populus x berolinensis]|nr:hypothetical protein NC652_011117 [Populus alba x Populus x berolinensis]
MTPLTSWLLLLQTWSNGGKEHIPSCNVDKAVSFSAAANAKDKGNGYDSTHKLAPTTWSNGGEEQITSCNVDKAASSSATAKAKDKDNGNGSTPLQLDAATCSNEELLAAAKCSNEKLPTCPSSAAHKDNDKDHVNVSTQLPLTTATWSISKETAIGHGFSRPCMIRLMDDIGVAVMLFWFWDRCCRLGFQQLVLAWVAVIGLAGSTSDYF